MFAYFCLKTALAKLRIIHLIIAYLFVICHVATGQVMIIVDHIPKATPEGDSIFITGTFNSWKANDPQYQLKRQLDGRLAVELPSDTGKIEYKFTRGDWQKVETDKNNQLIENRSFTFGSSSEIRVKIYNWMDLGGAKAMHYPVFYFFLVGFYGIGMLILASLIKKKSDRKFRIFTWVNLPLIITLCLTVWYYESNIIRQNYLSMAAMAVFYLWGPLIYVLVKTILNENATKFKLIHFLPFTIVAFFAFLRFTGIIDLHFLMEEISPNIYINTILWMGIGILWNTAYHVFLYRSVIQHKEALAEIPEQLFVKLIVAISILALVMTIINLGLILSGFNNSVLGNFEPTLFILSGAILTEAYFIWKYPDILKDKTTGTLLPPNGEKIKEELIRLMETEKIYTNPDLTISSLSEMLHVKPHVLSQLINRYYNKNYRDYINGYRVEEFIRMVRSKKYKHYTFLALAHEVGFNSKSTFNLAFKKIIGQSPSEYFQVLT